MTDQYLLDRSRSGGVDSREPLPAGTDRIGDLRLAEEAHDALVGFGAVLQEKSRSEQLDAVRCVDTDDDLASTSPEGSPATEPIASPWGSVRISRPAAPSIQKITKRPDQGQAADYSAIQGWRSKPSAVSGQLSVDTLRHNPDHYSIHNIPPQPDHGRGMAALAAAFVDRERKRPADTGHGKRSIWAYSHSGLDLRDFLENIADMGIEGSLNNRFDIVLACDSAEQRDAIRRSGLLHKWDVKIHVIDPSDTDSLALPQDVAVAILADSLDKLPAHQIYKGPKSHQPIEIVEETHVRKEFVTVGIDPRTGQASAVTSDALLLREAMNGSRRRVIAPRLSGNLTVSNLKTAITNTELAEDASEVVAFLDLQPERYREVGTVYNYARDLEPLIETVARTVNETGLIYISGQLRTNGWLHPDKLSASDGFVVSNVLEATAIQRAATVAGGATTVITASGAIENYGYALIDRTKPDDGSPDNTAELFRESLAAPDAEGEIATTLLQLEQERDSLRSATDAGEKARLAATIKEIFDHLAVIQTGTKRDYALALEIARDFNAAGVDELFADAIRFADIAAAAAPQLSSSLIEKARAEMGRGRLAEMQHILEQAADLSPENPEIYAIIVQAFDANEDTKAHFLPEYAEAAGKYLRYQPDLAPDAIIGLLESISEALLQDALQNISNEDSYKTIIIQDLETGQLREHVLSIKEIKRIIAADAALANAEVAGRLFEYQDVEAGKIRAVQEKLFAIWQRVVPRDNSSGMPLPRDEWPDLPQGLSEKWHYNGELYQSDTETGLGKINPNTINPYIHTGQALVETDTAIEDDDYPLEERTSMTLGKSINAADEPESEFQLFKHQFPGHVFIVGRTRMGKTTLYETMFEQLSPMNINFWAFDLSDKSELTDIAASLRGKDLSGDRSRAVELAENLRERGTEVIVIAPGDPDSIPVSIDLFTPVEGVTIEEHIGRFVDAWITAYGGGGDSPIAQLLASALRDIYAANGWPIKPADGETPQSAQRSERSTPSFEELKDACIRRSSRYAKGTDAGNIGTYFEVRINALQSGSFGDFLTGENTVDWDKLCSANVIWDLSRIASHDQRRFLVTALTMQATAHRIKKGLSKEIKTVWAFDEASLITQSAGEGQNARRQAVEAFTGRLRILGGYGVSIWNATQTIAGVDSLFLSQNAITIALPLKHHDDINGTLKSMGVREGTPAYERLYSYLLSGKPGDALAWTTGMKEPREIIVERALQLDPEQLARARNLNIKPYIKPNPYDAFTAGQRERALLESMDSQEAWKRLFIGAITIAHVAHTELPALPVPLRQQWQSEQQNDPDHARLLLYEIARQSVRERIPAVRQSYSPDRLITSVMANALSILNDEPGSRRVSAAFGIMPLRQILTSRRLADPVYGRSQHGRRYATPAPYPPDSPVPTIDSASYLPATARRNQAKFQTVEEQLNALNKQDILLGHQVLSEAQKRNKELAFIAAVGKYSGTLLWKSMRAVTGGELDLDLQRRLSATALGYLSTCYAPELSEFEEVLAAASSTYRQLLALAT